MPFITPTTPSIIPKKRTVSRCSSRSIACSRSVLVDEFRQDVLDQRFRLYFGRLALDTGCFEGLGIGERIDRHGVYRATSDVRILDRESSCTVSRIATPQVWRKTIAAVSSNTAPA